MRCPYQMRQVQSIYSRTPPTFMTETVHVDCCTDECKAWDHRRRDCRRILAEEKPKEAPDA